MITSQLDATVIPARPPLPVRLLYASMSDCQVRGVNISMVLTARFLRVTIRQRLRLHRSNMPIRLRSIRILKGLCRQSRSPYPLWIVSRSHRVVRASPPPSAWVARSHAGWHRGVWGEHDHLSPIVDGVVSCL